MARAEHPGGGLSGSINNFFLSNRLRISFFILLVELCERLTYYTIAGTQKPFLQDQRVSQAQATSISLAFTTMCYLWCIWGSILADNYWCRYNVIIVCLVCYVIGATMICIAALPEFNSKSIYIVGTMVFIAIGTGGMKPNICNFGTEQVSPINRSSFLQWFYWFINVGALVSFGYITSLATQGQEPIIPKEYGFFSAYAISACSLTICLAIFFAGRRFYVHSRPSLQERTIWTPLCRALWKARFTKQGACSLIGWSLWPLFFLMVFIQAFTASVPCAQATLFIGLLMVTLHVYAHYDNSWIVGGTDGFTEDDLQDTFRGLPVILVVNCVFSFAYSMLNGPFFSQACQMDLRIRNGQINGSFFNIADCIAIIIFVPICDWIFRMKPVSVHVKVLGGFSCTAVAMIIAIVLEILRRRAPVLDIGSNCAPLTRRQTMSTYPCPTYQVSTCSYPTL